MLLTSLRSVFTVDDDDILAVLLLTLQPPVQDIFGTGGVAKLCIESGTGVVSNHAVATAKGVLGSPPRVVLGCGLDVPHVTGVA